MARQHFDNIDKKILQLISEDARMPFLEIARACHVSGAAIHQRVQRLTQMGVLKGSQYILCPENMGFRTTAFIGMNLKRPEFFDDVVLALKNIPEIVECHYTTGDYDLLIKIHAVDNNALLKIIHDRLQPLKLTRTVTLVSLNLAFSRQLSPECIVLDEED